MALISMFKYMVIKVELGRTQGEQIGDESCIWSLIRPAGDQPVEQRCGSVVGAMAICWNVVPMVLYHTHSWNGWHNSYIPAHQLNLLEPGVVLLVNFVPHILQIGEDNIDATYCLHNIVCLCVRALRYPKH